MKELGFKTETIFLRIIAMFFLFLSIYGIAYSQNSFYSDPLLISTDTTMISTMAATALDKDGHLHIAFVGWYVEEGAPDGVASEIFYTNNISGEYLEPEKLPKAELPFPATFEDDFYYSKEPTIAVDLGGTVHVAYYRTETQLDGSSWICYTNNKNGDFSVPQILYYDSNVWSSEYYSYGNNIMLAADNKSDSIHIVFDGNSGTGHGGVRYSIGVDGNFSLPVTYAKKSEQGTIKFDNEGVPNIVYWLHSDTTDTFSDVNLVWSKIVDGQYTSPEILYMGESSFSRESAFAFDQNDTIHVVFRNLDLGIFHKQMQYVKGKDGFYSTPEELPTANWDVSLMYSIEIGNNQTKYIVYKIAGDNQSLGFMYNDGSGFKDISPVDDEKYGFISAGPQRFTLDKDNNVGYFVYTTGYIYLVEADLRAPSAPISISPSNNETNVSISPDLVWHSSERAFSYNLQVSTVSDFSSTIFNESGITSTSKGIGGLTNNTTYYWRVSATNAGGTSDWSEIWDFKTIDPLGINILSFKKQFRFFPNPVNNVLYFEGIENERSQVSIFTIEGKILKQMNKKGIKQIDLSDLQKGIYLLKVINSNIIYVEKIIRQ